MVRTPEQQLNAAGVDWQNLWADDPSVPDNLRGAMRRAGRSEHSRAWQSGGGLASNGMQADGRQFGAVDSTLANTGPVTSAVQPDMTALATSTKGTPDDMMLPPQGSSNPQSMFQNTSGIGDYDSYIDKTFSHAMRTLDPMIQQNEDRFNQTMIDRGLSPGSEAYGQAFDNNSRRYNDLASAAAFNAMNFGANRFDSDRQFDLNELVTIDGLNRAWDSVNFRNANWNEAREDQRFNQLLSLFGMTPTGSTTPFNAAGAAATGVNADLAALNQRNQMYSNLGQGIQDVVSTVPWGSIFGNSGVTANGGGIDGSNIDALLAGWL